MGGKTQKVTNETKVPKYIEDAYKMLVGRGEGIVDTPYDPAMNRGVAGFSPTQTQAFQGIQGMQGVQNPYLGQAQQYAQTGAGSITPENISQYSNPFQSQVIDSTMAQIARNNAIQQNQLKGNSVAQGGLRNSRLGVAQAELARNQDMTTADTLSKLNTQNYSQALGAAQADKARAFQGASAYGALGQQAQQAGYQDIAALMGAGAQQQGLEQLQLDTASQNAAQQHQYPFQNLSWLSSLVSGVGANAGGTSTQTTPGPSPLSQIAGIGLTALGLFSDEKVKENKKRVGWTDDGLPIFTYNYIGDPRTHMGLMAQDVEQVKPEAVGNVGGVKTVNYDVATEGAGPADLDGDGMISKLERMSHAAKGLGAIQKANGGRTEPKGIGTPTDMQETSPGNWEAPKGMATGGFTLTPDKIQAITSLLEGGRDKEVRAPEHINIGGRGFADGGMPGLGLDDEGIEDMYSADDALFNSLLQQESGDRDIQGPLITAGANAGDRAFGPAQLMPKTAANPGFGIRPYDANAADPLAENRRVGRDYLNAMLNRYKGDEEAALIAYNAGPANADKWVAAGRDYGVLPQRGQTEPYARNIMGMAGRAPANSEGAMRQALVQNAVESATPRAGIGAAPSAPTQQPTEKPGFLDSLFSGETNLPLVAAGLGILGGDSPFAGVNIGKGGLSGVQMVMQQRKAKEGAKKLAEAAAIAQQRLGIQQEQHAATLAERKRHNLEIEKQRANQGPSFSKNVIWGVGPNGEPALLQPGDQGKAIATELPEGFKVAKDPIKIDAGTEWILLDPQTRQPVGKIPKNVGAETAEKTTAEEEAKRRTEAKAALPNIEATATRVTGLIDRLDKDPMRQSFTGYSGYLPNISPEANDYQALLDQVGGNTFLQAFASLKGSGAITEMESRKAGEALSRLQAIAPSDAGYQSALDDTKAVMLEILQNARKRAGVETQAPTTPPPPSGDTGGFKVLKVE